MRGKFTKCYANKPVINHRTCNFRSCGSEVRLTVIPIFQGENANYNGPLLIWKSSAQSWKKKQTPNHKSVWVWGIPCNCSVSWLLSRVNIASSQMKSQFVCWQVHVGPLFSHWDFCPLIDRDVKENGYVALLAAVNFFLSPEFHLNASL